MILISDKYKILYAEIARVVTLRQNSLLQSIAPNSCLRIITHLAMRSKRRKMRCNYNSKTRLQNNNRYAKAVFIQILKREIEFEDKRSSIYYYTKTADNIVATKLYRAIFIIKLLI
ncbi:hypothetical protein HBI06_254790 [Parastagonospora nodorum]|nr:hypothetical protein HBI06_254790 [Parastagonospora nodorum]KAH4223066.1 hypothetical protein HBI05_250780 [Parastagonospora nodorum]